MCIEYLDRLFDAVFKELKVIHAESRGVDAGGVGHDRVQPDHVEYDRLPRPRLTGCGDPESGHDGRSDSHHLPGHLHIPNESRK